MTDLQDHGGRETGYVFQCPRCGARIDRFSDSDEWFCECGESGEVFYPDEDSDEE